MCSDVDIDYWLSGTAPVLLVCSHPERTEAWFKHLPSWFGDPRRRRERYVEFDKEDDRFDGAAARRLLTLGADTKSGLYLRPPPRAETLTTNLLRVEHTAQHVYAAPTHCRGWPDARPRLVKAGHDFVNDVVFRDQSVYSFRRLDEPPLDVLADGSAETLETDELAESTNADDQTLIRWLLKATLLDMTGRDLRRHPDNDYLYFKAPRDGSDKRIKVGRGTGRAVVQRYEAPEGQTWLSYTRHYALHSQFIYTDSNWFLALTPTYHDTSDGRDDFPYASTQLATIKRFEGHEAVRSQTAFWARYIGSRTLFNQADPRLRFGALSTAAVDRGIDDKSWKPVQIVGDADSDDFEGELPDRLFDPDQEEQ